jgi:hypothetical protein
VRRTALDRLKRTDDDLTDAEIFARQGNDDFWFVDLCLEKLHRLPIEVEPLLLCRHHTELQAYHVIRSAMADLARAFQET